MLSLLFLLVPDAAAFCGLYVGSAGTALSNQNSQVVLAHSGGTTTLTLAQDVTTNSAEFALVVPVPSVMGQGDVREVDPASLKAIDLYSAPRLVAYPCDAYAQVILPPPGPAAVFSMMACFASAEVAMAPDSGTGGGDGEMLEATVTVEAAYQTGAYDIQVLSAEDAGGLLTWLGENGYEVAANAQALIQEYLDGGSYFFVAKVRLDRQGEAWLPPLQFSYESEVLSLPIRLGALNGLDLQEMLVYTITPDSEGNVGISNFREVDIENECLVPEGSTFEEHFQLALDNAFDGEAAWVREYSWANGACDPCTGPTIDVSTVRELGFNPGPRNQGFSVNRFRMRYDPEVIDRDVVFYTSAGTAFEQVRYISYEPGLTWSYPTCLAGYESIEGAECYTYDDYGGCGSSSSGCCAGGFAVTMVAPFALLLRRRRRE